VAAFAPMDESKARRHVPTVIHVDESNRPRELRLATG
jgi:aspartate 1-decarboxylase